MHCPLNAEVCLIPRVIKFLKKTNYGVFSKIENIFRKYKIKMTKIKTLSNVVFQTLFRTGYWHTGHLKYTNMIGVGCTLLNIGTGMLGAYRWVLD